MCCNNFLVFAVKDNSWPRWVTVTVGLLCISLLLLITAIRFKYTLERNHLKSEQDQLKTERDQLKSERDKIKSLWINLDQEKNQLLSSNSKLIKERDQLLQAMADQTKNSNLTVICPSGWVFHRKCYHISFTRRTWIEARKACQAMGADLVTIESEDEQVYINSLKNWGWIGLRHENSWNWVNNRPLSAGPVFWGPGQPNSDTENCVMSSPNDNIPMSNWDDYPCNDLFYAICEKTAN